MNLWMKNFFVIYDQKIKGSEGEKFLFTIKKIRLMKANKKWPTRPSWLRHKIVFDGGGGLVSSFFTVSIEKFLQFLIIYLLRLLRKEQIKKKLACMIGVLIAFIFYSILLLSAWKIPLILIIQSFTWKRPTNLQYA